jgi:hypothetical protein
MPLCADHPGCRNFVCVPSTQHSRIPDAKLPQMPAARAVAAASSPSSREARYVTPNVAKSPDGWKPRGETGRARRPGPARNLVAHGDRGDEITA